MQSHDTLRDYNTALLIIRRLLDSCELNMDDMEPETHTAIAEAEQFLTEQKWGVSHE